MIGERLDLTEVQGLRASQDHVDSTADPAEKASQDQSVSRELMADQDRRETGDHQERPDQSLL